MMRKTMLLPLLVILLSLKFLACFKEKKDPNSFYQIPTTNHDLSYIPYDARFDNLSYKVCDSTNINSGRNRLQYIGGKNKLEEDIRANYLFKQGYADFSGYLIIRFLVNCESESGRYRSEALNLDFTTSVAPPGLLHHIVGLIKSLDNWEKTAGKASEIEYSKFINLKIINGKIQHVLL